MKNMTMNCLEFKRLSLSDPNSSDENFVEHSNNCPDCVKYIGEVRKMDRELSASLHVPVPSNLTARLQLNLEMSESGEQARTSKFSMRHYAVAASVAVIMLVGGFLLSNNIGLNQQISQDAEQLLAGVVEHMNEQAFTPVWESARANRTAQTLLASYDDSLRLKDMPNLQFSRICPMGQYHGLHATLHTADGQITFAYIKGPSVNEILDTAYAGYMGRVKPVRGGNLVIISRNMQSLEVADRELQQAMYWDI